jgi:hypothetical protein
MGYLFDQKRRKVGRLQWQAARRLRGIVGTLRPRGAGLLAASARTIAAMAAKNK